MMNVDEGAWILEIHNVFALDIELNKILHFS